MRLLSITSLAVGLVFGELAFAKGLFHGPRSLHRRHEPLEEHVRREAFEFIDAELEPRQELSPRGAPATLTSSGPPANLNDPATNMTIAMACVNAFADITDVSNAAGWAACYNVLYLNNQTGIFEADLRLYQVDQPSGAFAGIQSSDIHLALNYQEAAISATSQQTRRSELVTRQLATNMSQLQQYSFVGQIDKRLTLTHLKATDLMALVIPSISLYAQSQSNSMVSTNMTSASIAFFATGVFAGQGASAAAAALPTAVALAAQRAAAFTMPGKTLGIFPVGGIITAAWIVLFVTTFGLGTIGRIVSRKEYRQHRSTAAPTPVETAQDSVPPLRRLLSRKVSNSKRPGAESAKRPGAESAKQDSVTPLRRMLSRKLSNSQRPAADSAPSRKESRSKKNAPLSTVVEMVNYEITYDKTFGERPNYYLEHLPSYRTANRQL